MSKAFEVAKMRSNNSRRRRNKPHRKSKSNRGKYKNYSTRKLELSLDCVKVGISFGEASSLTDVPKSTTKRLWKEMNSEIDEGECSNTREFVKNGVSSVVYVLNEDEENAVKKYCLWQFDRGLGFSPQQAIIREINRRATCMGEKRQKINEVRDRLQIIAYLAFSLVDQYIVSSVIG